LVVPAIDDSKAVLGALSTSFCLDRGRRKAPVKKYKNGLESTQSGAFQKMKIQIQSDFDSIPRKVVTSVHAHCCYIDLREHGLGGKVGNDEMVSHFGQPPQNVGRSNFQNSAYKKRNTAPVHNGDSCDLTDGKQTLMWQKFVHCLPRFAIFDSW
jgi:hypothetical protein